MEFPIQQGRMAHCISRFKSVLLSTMLISVLIAGCGNKHVPPPQIVFTIESENEANDGQPFHCAIRSVNAKQFLTEGYDGVANMLFANPPDSTVLATIVILPGDEQELQINKPDQNDLGFYCFFTQPGDPWKVRLEQPLGEEYEISLGKSEILETEKADGSWWWPF
ncbi:MAG: hypothetical protein JSU80_04420 [Deltaproteobacteria bacterium]|nr:MAG: hypothetical protein JSU80_04420 [Deltaproteobacteria bacterium]